MKRKKLSILITFIVMMFASLFISNEVEAANLNPNLFLGVQEFRQNTTPANMAYGINNPDRNGDSTDIRGAKIWKLVKYNDLSESKYDDKTTYYCVKAGVGFANTGDKATYDTSYNFKTQRDLILQKNDPNLNSIVNIDNGAYYNIMAIADLLYIPGVSSEQDKNNLLSNIPDDGYTVSLTDSDIDAVQQAAIWYFTNYDDKNFENVYNQLEKTGWFTYKEGMMTDYKPMSDYTNGESRDEGKQRETQAIELYKYLINSAKINADKYKNGTANSNTEITLYIHSTNLNQQPVIEITRNKIFDLALRKYITGNEIVETWGVKNSRKYMENHDYFFDRRPEIDESTISTNHTATYKHKKNPEEVLTNCYVTYDLTVYNEGEKAGRATKIIDQLPTGLEFKEIITPGFNAVVDEKTNRVTITREETNNKNLAPYTPGKLSSETVQIVCKVIQKQGDKPIILTNVAWIEEQYDAEKSITITNQKGEDRDSEPHSRPDVNKDNMSDYKGTTSEEDLSKKIYYPGQQDDDDFEKLILPPREKTFDLALRKYITKLGDKVLIDVNSRIPNIDESTIETNYTATYKHRKDPLLVKTGDEVTYNLTVYNEGEKAGRATKIIDQLPTGLEFVKIVTPGFIGKANSDTNTLIITREKSNEKNLNPYTQGNLDSETIEIVCKVTQEASEEEKILTNVAWIEEEYNAEDKITITNQKRADRDSEPHSRPDVNKDNMSEYKGNTNEEDLSKNIYYPGLQDDDDFEKLKIKPVIKEFDLKLIKSIFEVNNQKVPERIESIDTSKLNTIDSNGKKITTAEYKLNKDPVQVKKGDIIKYRLRVYNEGELDGYAAQISEDVPQGLEFIWSTKTEDEIKNDANLSELEKEAILYNQLVWDEPVVSENGRIDLVKSTYLARGKGQDLVDSNLINAFDSKKGLDYKEIYVYMKVVSENISNEVIRNEAAITKYKDKNDITIIDRDSEEDKWVKYEDDEDFDKVILQTFDLALRKFIIAVSKDTVIEDNEYLKESDGKYTREPQVDTSKLNTIGDDGKVITTAKYNHSKKPVSVTKNDIVVYMFRVYNEGDIAGYAKEIKDYLPQGLEFVDGEFNKKYGWVYDKENHMVKTDYLKDSLINEISKEDGKIVLDYKEVPIMCKVKEDLKSNVKQTNIAEISISKDENGKDVIDRDSEINDLDVPKEDDKPSYKDDEKGDYVPGQEDDDDFEKVVIEPFDLALRKFITKVENNTVDTRIPQVKYDKENNKITYEHSKVPVDVVSGNIVTYTIRVYNEGARNGYAAEVEDDIPNGLQYLPENDLNKEYRWVMYDKDGNVTADVNNAISIKTDYLSKEQGEERMKQDNNLKENPNLLNAFDKDKEISENNPDYKDVKVAFKVVEPNTSDKVIINSAQISKDTDENGKDVDDDDSKPGEWNDGEDDQDREYIKLNYFDLALRKWVTQAIVIENGKEKITQTGHTAEQDPEPVVKVDLHRKKLNNVVVKFRYSIRVTNQGDIAGYAKEIKDYVPQGLKFIAKDNPGWKDLGNNVIVTNLLADKLLQPGESAEVQVVLTWINGKDNLGLKVNNAEISKDYNDKNVPDKDSVPDNKKSGEDDIDDAPVIIAVATGIVGNPKIYYTLGLIVLVTVAGGIVLIKKYVL